MRDIIQLLEDKAKPQDIEIIPLNFTASEVKPVLSQDTLDLHYDLNIIHMIKQCIVLKK